MWYGPKYIDIYHENTYKNIKCIDDSLRLAQKEKGTEMAMKYSFGGVK